jgi:hypothetical protein
MAIVSPRAGHAAACSRVVRRADVAPVGTRHEADAPSTTPTPDRVSNLRSQQQTPVLNGRIELLSPFVSNRMSVEEIVRPGTVVGDRVLHDFNLIAVLEVDFLEVPSSREQVGFSC